MNTNAMNANSNEHKNNSVVYKSQKKKKWERGKKNKMKKLLGIEEK